LNAIGSKHHDDATPENGGNVSRRRQRPV